MKTVQKVRSYFMCTVMAAALLVGFVLHTGMVKAESYVEKVNGVSWEIDVQEDGIVSVKPKKPSQLKGNVIIPKVVNGYTVNHIGKNAFASLGAVKEITVPDSVTVIEEKAFANCNKLQKVNLSKKLTTISNGLFYGCDKLMYAKIPEGVTVIGKQAFEGCTKLKEVEIPYGVACIGEQAFNQCKRLKTVTFPRSVVSIGSRAFAYCGLKTAVIPNEVTDMPEDIFYGDHTLRDIYYLGTRLQWNKTGCKELAEPGFTYRDHAGYHITVHFFASVTLTDPVSATYIVDAEDVAPLCVSAVVDTADGQTLEHISYQWYVNTTADNTSGTAIENALANEYIPPVNEPGQKYYYCVTTIAYADGQSSYASATAKITVLPPVPDVEQEQESQTVDKKYKVTFIGSDNFDVPEQIVKENELVRKPVIAIEDDYVKVVWYTDENYVGWYNFAEPVTKNLTLYGREELDYTPLQIAVNEARTILAKDTYISRYTTQSVQRYSTVVDVAQEMVRRKSASCKQALVNMVESVKAGRKLLIIKPEERPVPEIQNGIAVVKLHNEQLTIHQYLKGIAFGEEEFKELYKDNGIQETKEIELDKSGFYTFFVTDPFEDDFYLIVYYDSESGSSSFFDLTLLAYEIQKAEILCDTTPVGKENLPARACYTNQEAKKAYQEVIVKAKENFAKIETLQDAETILSDLRKGESAFRDSFLYVDWVTVAVEGSTVRVIPMETYTVSVVQFNVDENGQIAEGLWNDWSGFTSKPYSQKTKDFVWNDVPDGVYTFIITLKDQAGGTVWGIKRFAVAVDLTREEVMESYIRTQIADAKETLETAEKASEVADGELCVPDGIYNYLKNGIDQAQDLLNNPRRTYDWMMDASYKLTAGMRDFELNKEIKVTVSHEVEIKVDNGKITVSGADLFKCSYSKGDYNTDEEYINAGFQSITLLEGTGNFQVHSNGTYTVRCLFRDDYIRLEKIEVSDILKASEIDGKLVISYAGEQEVVSTKYAYDDGSNKLNYKTYAGLKEELTELGNGTYVIVLKYANGEEDTVRVEATACKEPVILQEGNTLTAYDYGFSFVTAMYAKGHFNEWEDMFSLVFNVVKPNTAMDTSSFEKGEYTFYFQDAEGNVYWKYITIE